MFFIRKRYLFFYNEIIAVFFKLHNSGLFDCLHKFIGAASHNWSFRSIYIDNCIVDFHPCKGSEYMFDSGY